jgi:uncharacterized protein YjiK
MKPNIFFKMTKKNNIALFSTIAFISLSVSARKIISSPPETSQPLPSKVIAPNAISLTLLNTYSISSVPEPSDLTYDKVNNQLFSVSDTGNIYRLSVTGQLLQTYTFAGDLEGVSMSGTANTLIVAIEDTYKLVEYNYLTGSKITHTMSYTNQGVTSSGIEGVTYNTLTGEVYFLNEKDPGALIVANSSYNVTNEYPISFAGDYSACDFVDESGYLWIGSDQDSSVYKCTTDGTVVQTFNLGTLNKLEGIAIDYDRQILYVVTDGDAKLYVYQINDPEFPNITLSTLSSFTASGSSKTISVNSNVNWTVTDNQSWISVSPTSGSNNSTITVTVAPYTGSFARTGTVTVTNGTITKTVTVTQTSDAYTIAEIPIVAATAIGTETGKTNVATGFAWDNVVEEANYWSANSNTSEASITFDLSCNHEISSIGINLLKSDLRITNFNVAVARSESSSSFVTIISNQNSAIGTYDIEQNFSFPAGIIGRYVKFIGNNNSVGSGWISLSELSLYGNTACSSELGNAAFESLEGKGVCIYPVPVTQGVLNIVSEKTALYSIEIVNLNGQKVMNTNAQGLYSSIINTAKLPAGIYLVVLEGIGTTKFVID